MADTEQQGDEYGYSQYERTDRPTRVRNNVDSKSLYSTKDDQVGKSLASLRENTGPLNGSSTSRRNINEKINSDNVGERKWNQNNEDNQRNASGRSKLDENKRFTQEDANDNFKKQLAQRADGDTKVKTDSTKPKQDKNKNVNKNKGEKSPRGTNTNGNTINDEKKEMQKKDREANAKWQSEWEHKETTNVRSPRSNVQNKNNVPKKSNAHNNVAHAKSSEGKDGVFRMGTKPSRKLGESKDKEASVQAVGDFYGNNMPRKSVREMTKRDVSPRRYGDFYPNSMSMEENDFVTKLEEESRNRSNSYRSNNNGNFGNSSEYNRPSSPKPKREESLGNEEKYWLVMDLETNKGFRVRKASSPKSVFGDDRIDDDNRIVDSRRSSRMSTSRSMELPDNPRQVQYSTRKMSTIQRPWEKSADPRNRVNKADDIFRKDKANQAKMGVNQGKAPWDSIDSERAKKNPDDIFRRDASNVMNLQRSQQQSKAPWETPKKGEPNDFDTMFGKPAYNRSKRSEESRPNATAVAEQAKWDTMGPSNMTKAEQYHKMIHHNEPGLGQGY